MNLQTVFHTSPRAAAAAAVAFVCVGFLGAAGEASLVFPIFVSGEIDSVRNATRVIIRNNRSQENTGTVVFRNADGDVVSVPVNGVSASQFPYAIQAWGSVEIKTDGTGTLASGSVEIVSDQEDAEGLEATVIFDVLGNNVSVNSRPLLRSHQVYVSVDENENTGIAIYNPSAEVVDLDVYLIDNKGQQVSKAELKLEAGQQFSKFVDESDLFSEFFQANPDPFQGALSIVAVQDVVVSVTGLIQKRANGALIAVSTSSRVFVPEN